MTLLIAHIILIYLSGLIVNIGFVKLYNECDFDNKLSYKHILKSYYFMIELFILKKYIHND